MTLIKITVTIKKQKTYFNVALSTVKTNQLLLFIIVI